jgi:hypothetical protein
VDGVGERAGPMLRNVSSPRQATWLVVMTAMRDSGWP